MEQMLPLNIMFGFLLVMQHRLTFVCLETSGFCGKFLALSFSPGASANPGSATVCFPCWSSCGESEDGVAEDADNA